MIHPDKVADYRSSVLDGGDQPRFQVVASDQPDNPIIASSATGAWTAVIKGTFPYVSHLQR